MADADRVRIQELLAEASRALGTAKSIALHEGAESTVGFDIDTALNMISRARCNAPKPGKRDPNEPERPPWAPKPMTTDWGDGFGSA